MQASLKLGEAMYKAQGAAAGAGNAQGAEQGAPEAEPKKTTTLLTPILKKLNKQTSTSKAAGTKPAAFYSLYFAVLITASSPLYGLRPHSTSTRPGSVVQTPVSVHPSAYSRIRRNTFFNLNNPLSAALNLFPNRLYFSFKVLLHLSQFLILSGSQLQRFRTDFRRPGVKTQSQADNRRQNRYFITSYLLEHQN